ncbi:hypothetical protein HN51_008873 [Arachis hypogaea]
MIKGLCKEGLFEEALALLLEMEDNEALAFLSKMEDNDKTEKPCGEKISRGLLQGKNCICKALPEAYCTNAINLDKTRSLVFLSYRIFNVP